MTQEEITRQSNEVFPILNELFKNGEFENVIKDLRKKFKKMAKKKKVAKPVVKANDLKPCDPGYTRDANGICQKDPLPGDPTHQ